MAKTSLMNISDLYRKAINWVKENPKEFIILLIIISVALVLRLYRIGEYMTFLGDEGRDAIVVRRLLVNFDPILVGPGTSIGNMYLGPIYYYMIAFPLLLAGFSPVGPSIFVALVGVATVFLIWFISRNWFGKTASFVAAGLYAISPTVILFSRSSWNPNIMPFFSLLLIYSLWKVWYDEKWNWILVTGISFGIVLQSHYMGLLLLPIIFIFWILSLFKSGKSLDRKKEAFKFSALSIIAVIFLMSPIVLFDARHGWRNFTAMRTFFVDRQITITAKPWSALPKIPEIAGKINTSLLSGRQGEYSPITGILFILGIIWVLFGVKEKFNVKKTSLYFLLFTWLMFSLVGLGIYKQVIYDHYFGFMFPLPFLIVGLIVSKTLKSENKILKYLTFFAIVVFVLVNIKGNPLRQEPNKQMQKTTEITQKIVEEAKGEKFNIAVIAERNYEGAYQYFLEKWNAPFSIIDPQRYEETVANQLFVVCEYEDKNKCQPTSNPKSEVANFGWSKIDKSWEIQDIILYRLIHNYPQM